MIWYLIASVASVHINKNAEELRSTFVSHMGKEIIKIRRDDLMMDNSIISIFEK